MTLLSAVVDKGTLVGVAAGMTAPPQPTAGSTINGSTTLPSTTSGSVTLTVHAKWPSPGPQDVTGTATVQLPGACAQPKGSLKVTKAVDWNGVTPDQAKTFEICITGPSYPNGNCKSADFDGATLTWNDLTPGNYTAAETSPGASWIVSGSPTGTITVPALGGPATNEPTITNTRKHGSLSVIKSVDWNGVTPDQSKTFEICITGPSYPNGNCKTADFDGATLTWNDLIPGAYSATETNPGSSWTVTGSPSGTITVPSNGGSADPVTISNTRKHGSLKVTKTVDWNGVTPDQSKTFEICITGPSFPNGDCKNADFDGATLTWTDLIPGDYTATETNPGSAWTVAGSPSGVITVPSNGGLADTKPTITNTRKHGSLQVSKSVDWNGVTPDQSKTFEICITGPSFPNGDCKSVGANGGTATWTDLIPGAYTAAETNPGPAWTITGSPTGTITVPSNGGSADSVPVITNQRKHGSLKVTKAVDWNGVTPDQSKTFEVCITGPSYPTGDCKSVGASGGSLTWTDLIPGNYSAAETFPGSHWSVAGSPTGMMAVPDDGGQAANKPTITNTRKHGSLQVTKSVNWNGVTPDQSKTFEICITGPSFPNGDCKTIGDTGGTLTWSNLIPGAYTATESAPGAEWTVSGSPSDAITVPADGSMAELVPVINNVRKHGSLHVTKHVAWNGVAPVDGQEFSVCIAGPSFGTPNCKTFTAPDGLDQSWSDLIPGTYTISEASLGSEWTQSGDTSAVVDNVGGTASADVTNTRKHGSLSVTKAVDWNGVTPNEDKTFSICITGPSFPNDPDCKTVDFDGATVTWTDLIPGDYVASETFPGVNWTIDGNPSATITVPADGTAAEFVPVITNTRKHGSLVVTKVVDWNGTTPDPAATFQICVTGPSYPTGNCKTIGSSGGELTWTDLQPGNYTVAETDPGTSWTVAIRGNPAVVSASGGDATASVTNTHKPTEVLGEVLARTGGDDSSALALGALVVVAAACRRIIRRRRGLDLGGEAA